MQVRIALFVIYVLRALTGCVGFGVSGIGGFLRYPVVQQPISLQFSNIN